MSLSVLVSQNDNIQTPDWSDEAMKSKVQEFSRKDKLDRGPIGDAMEVVWHGEFDRFFQFFSPTHWRLLPIAAPPQDELNIFQDSAKVRFQCGECGRGWMSMKGRVTFWLDVDEARGTGDIYFKLYGQQCKHCSNSEFEHAMWYPEEVFKVVFNLYMHIGQRYYNFQQPAIRVDRRQGKPRSQHDSKLCQACADGICKEAWSTAS